MDSVIHSGFHHPEGMDSLLRVRLLLDYPLDYYPLLNSTYYVNYSTY